MTFAGASIPGNEFTGPMTFDANVTTAVTYTLATRPLNASGSVTVQNSTALATGNVTLDASANNLALTLGALTLSTLGVVRSGTAAVSISGAGGANATGVNVSASNAYIITGTGNWSVTNGCWSNSSTSSSWSWGSNTVTIKNNNNCTASGLKFGAASNFVGGYEFNALVLDSNASAATTVAYTMATNGLVTNGNLTIKNTVAFATGNVILDNSVNNLNITVKGGGLTLDTLGVLKMGTATVSTTGNVLFNASNSYATSVAGGSWTVNDGTWTNSSTSGSWSLAGSVIFKNGTGRAMVFCGTNCGGGSGEFSGGLTFDSNVAGGMTYTLGTRGLNVTGAIAVQNSAASPSGNTVLDTSGSNFPVTTTSSITLGTRGTLTANGSTIRFRTFDGSGSNAVFNKGSSLMEAATTGGTVRADAGNFNNFTVDNSVTIASNGTVSVDGTTTVSGVWDTSTFITTITSLASLGGGIKAGASGTKTIGNSALIINSTGYFVFGGATWNMSMSTWTNNSTSGSWDATGSGTVKFTTTSAAATLGAGAAGNYTSGVEFPNLTFDPNSASGATWTLSINALKVNGTLTVQNSAAGGTVTFRDDTNNKTFTAGGVTIGANGTLTLGSGTSTVSGNWDSSNSTAVFNKGTSIVTLSGPSTTVAIRNASNGFYSLTVSGTIAQNTAIDVSNTLTITGTLTTSGNNITGNANLSVSGGGTLMGSSATMSFTDVVMTGASSNTISLTTGSIAASGNWDTSGSSSTWDHGTSGSVTLSGSGKTVKMQVSGTNNEFYTLTISGTISTLSDITMKSTGPGVSLTGTLTIANTLSTNGTSISGGGDLTIDTGGMLTANASSVTVRNVTMTSATSGTITLTTGSWMVGGNWDTSGAGTTFTMGTSTVTLSGSSNMVKIRNSSNGFYNLTVSGTVTQGGAIDVSNALSVTGTLTTSGNSITGGANLTVSGGGVLAGSSASMTFTNVTMTGASANTISLTTGSITASGNWDTSGSSSTWDHGTSGAVTLSGSGKTLSMRVGGANNEFYALTISGSISTLSDVNMNPSGSVNITGRFTVANTFTTNGAPISSGGDMTVTAAGTLAASTSTLILGALTVNGLMTKTTGDWSASSVTLDGGTYTQSSGSPTITISGNLTIRNGGAGAFSGATVSVVDVTMNDTAANALTLTSGLWTVSGNWDTSGAGSTYTGGTGTVTMTGAARTLKVLSTNSTFGSLTIAGTISLLSAINVTNALTVSGGTFDKATYVLKAGSLTLSGGNMTSTSGDVTINGNVSISSMSSAIAFGTESWTVGGTWTNSSTSTSWSAGTATVTLSGVGTLTPGAFSQAEFYNLSLTGSGTVVLARALNVAALLTISTATTLDTTASNYPLTVGSVTIAGTLTARSSSLVVRGSWDSSGGSFTQDGSITFSGSSGTMAIQSSQFFSNLTVTGSYTPQSSLRVVAFLTLNGGSLTMGTNSLVVNGNLSISGPGSLTSVGGSIAVTGNVALTGSASVDFGASTWTVSGSWTDTSTLANTAGTSTIIFNATAPQTIQGGIFNNVVLSGGEKEFTADFTTNDLTLTGAALAMKVGTSSASVTWTTYATAVIQGQTGAILTIAPASTSYPWTLSVQGGNGVAYHVAISYSNAKPGATAMGADSSVDAYSSSHGWNAPISPGPPFPWALLGVAVGVAAALLAFLVLHRRTPEGDVILKAYLFTDKAIVLQELVSDQEEPPVKFREIFKFLVGGKVAGDHWLDLSPYRVAVVQEGNLHLAAVTKVDKQAEVTAEAHKLLKSLLGDEDVKANLPQAGAGPSATEGKP